MSMEKNGHTSIRTQFVLEQPPPRMGVDALYLRTRILLDGEADIRAGAFSCCSLNLHAPGVLRPEVVHQRPQLHLRGAEQGAVCNFSGEGEFPLEFETVVDDFFLENFGSEVAKRLGLHA